MYESFLPANGTYFESDMRDLLRYLAFHMFYLLQMHLVHSSSAECSALSLAGIQIASRWESLLAFCSQTAPYRPNTETDMSAQYQVKVSSGDITVFG